MPFNKGKSLQGILFFSLMLNPAYSIFLMTVKFKGCPCGVMVKAMDCGIVVSEFVFQSSY